MLFYMLPFHSFKQWRDIGLDENYNGDLRTITITTAITFKEHILFAVAIPASDMDANLVTVVKFSTTKLNSIDVFIKGIVTGGSNGRVRVVFIGK